jgi:hypothetical protein
MSLIAVRSFVERTIGAPARGALPFVVALVAALALLFLLPATAHAQPSNPAFPPLRDVGACAANRPGAPNNFNCTANDIVIADVRVTNGVTSCRAGEKVTLQLAVDFLLNANQRFDLGVYLALDGTSPVNGSSCLRQQFPTTSPFANLDGDGCGDANTNISNFAIPETVTLTCTPGPDGSLIIPALTFWEQRGDQRVCSQVPGTSAKCGLQEIRIEEVTVTGALTVVKVADPKDGTLFNFNTTGAVVTSFQLNNDPGATQVGPILDRITLDVPIRAGQSSTVNIIETLPGPEWQLISVSCGGVPQFAFTPASSNISSGSVTLTSDQPTATCTFTNRKKAAVAVTKRTQPVGGVGDFVIKISGGSANVNINTTLAGDGASFNTGFTLAPAGLPYIVAETALPAGWKQAPWVINNTVPPRTDVSFCTLRLGVAVVGQFANQAVVPAGHTLDCTVTNIRDATLTVVKQVVGTTTPSPFTFILSDGSERTVLAAEGSPGSTTFANLAPRTYTLQEFAPGKDWTPGDFVCTFAGGSPAPITGPSTGVNVPLAAGASATCVITNTRNGNIIIEKQTDPPGADEAFGVGLYLNGITQTVWALKDGGVVDTGPLPPDTYVLRERVPLGWRQLSFTCTPSGDPAAGIVVAPGTTTSCIIVNQKLGKVTVQKIARTELLSQRLNAVSFDFSGTLGAFSVRTVLGFGEEIFTDVIPGPITIVEEPPPAGWEFVSVVCRDDATRVVVGSGADFTLAPGQSVTCLFRNQLRIPKIELVKEVTAATDTRCANAVDAKTVAVGEAVVYCFEVRNTGNVTLTGPILLNDPILGIVDLPVTPVPLAVGDSRLVTATAIYASVGVTINTASVIDQPTQVTDTDAATVSVADIGLLVRKLVGPVGGPHTNSAVGDPLTVDVGDPLEWVIEVENPNAVPIVVAWPPDDLLNGSPLAVVCQSGGPSAPSFTLPAGGTASCVLQPSFTASPGLSINDVIVSACREDIPTICTDGADSAAYTTRPRLTVTKVVVNNYGGTAVANDFELFVISGTTSVPAQSGVIQSLDAGDWTVAERPVPGYELTEIGGDCNADGYVTLENGIDSSCTLTNTDLPAELTVLKVVEGPVPVERILTTFGIVVNGQLEGQISPPGGGVGPVLVSAGTSVVSELIVPNPDDYLVTFGGDCDAQGNVTVTIGDSALCIITNTVRARIAIEKVTQPENTGSFSFATSWQQPPVVVTPPNKVVSPPLDPGTYSISEIAQTGWILDGAKCSNRDLPDAVTVQPGDRVTCSFANTQQGRIIIRKQVTDNRFTGTFVFANSWASDFSLLPGGVYTSPLLEPGIYTVAETPAPGWGQESATCDDPDSTVTNIRLDPGETVTCTFVNKPLTGQIAIVKETSPLGSPQQFKFDASFLTAPIALRGGDVYLHPVPLINSILAGTYAVSETLPSGWLLDQAFCDNQDLPNAIFLEPGRTVTCTFRNSVTLGTIAVKKVAIPADLAQGVLFPFLGGIINTSQSDLQDFEIESGDSQAFADLLPSSEVGAYQVVELVPPGWDLANVTCDNGDPAQNIILRAGQQVTCTFTNTAHSTIVVEKVVIPATDTTPFSFTTSFTDSFTLAGGESFVAPRLLAGATYAVRELPVAGYELQSATCDNGQSPAAIVPQPGQTVTCTFTNRALPATLGDRVWNDLNRNGLQESGEPGLPGVRVDLLAPLTPATAAEAQAQPLAGDGASLGVVATATTNAQGNYLFTPLPGSYAIRVTLPAGFAFTVKQAGSNDAIDSDVGPDGLSRQVTLAPAQSFLNLDAGLVGVPSSDEPTGEPVTIYLPMVSNR